MGSNLKFNFFRSGVALLLIALRGNNPISFTPNHITSIVVSSSVQTFYLQETEIVSNAAGYPSKTMASLSSTFTNTDKYAWSAWIYKTAWSGDWESYFRISLDPSYKFFFRIKSNN